MRERERELKSKVFTVIVYQLELMAVIYLVLYYLWFLVWVKPSPELRQPL